MIEHNDQKNQLPKELKSVFKELEVFKYLRKAGIMKKFGFSISYLFQLNFCLIFHQKSWFTLLNSKKGDCYPAKDSVYRFLNHSKFAWRRFLTYLSAHAIQKVELLARCMDHSSLTKRFYRGFRMLTLGWSDGFSFMPLDFTLLSSKNAQINGISENIDKRSSGYKRRVEALESAPTVIPGMLERAL